MITEKQRELILKSAEHWGIPSQFDQLHEEVGELIVEINHLKRNRTTIDKVITEISDVRLMLKAIKTILEISDEDCEKSEEVQWEKWERQLNKSIEKDSENV